MSAYWGTDQSLPYVTKSKRWWRDFQKDGLSLKNITIKMADYDDLHGGHKKQGDIGSKCVHQGHEVYSTLVKPNKYSN